MANFTRYNFLASCLIGTGVMIYFMDSTDSIATFRFWAFILLLIFASWIDYARAYDDGRKNSLNSNYKLIVKECNDWNNEYQLDIKDLIDDNPFCLLELNRSPISCYDKPSLSGKVYLIRSFNTYVVLNVSDGKWTYSSNTTIDKKLLNTGKYKLMLTSEAIKFI